MLGSDAWDRELCLEAGSDARGREWISLVDLWLTYSSCADTSSNTGTSKVLTNIEYNHIERKT